MWSRCWRRARTQKTRWLKIASLSANSGRISWSVAKPSLNTSSRSTQLRPACTPWETTSPALRHACSPSFTIRLRALTELNWQPHTDWIIQLTFFRLSLLFDWCFWRVTLRLPSLLATWSRHDATHSRVCPCASEKGWTWGAHNS